MLRKNKKRTAVATEDGVTTDGTAVPESTPRKPKKPVLFSVQIKVDVSGNASIADGEYWRELSTGYTSPKLAKEYIGALEQPGTYRIARVVATVTAKPRTGLQLDLVK